MPPLLRRHLIGTGNRKIPSRPQADIIRQRPSCTSHKVCNTLDTGQLHAVPGLFFILIRDLLGRRITGQQTLDHKLQESVLRRQFGSAAKGDFADLVYRISLIRHFSGKTHIDVVLAQPFQQTDKTRIDPKDICADCTFLSIKFKSGPPDRISKQSVRVMLQLPRTVIQHQNRMRSGRLLIIGIKYFICAFGNIRFPRRIVKIKNRHDTLLLLSVYFVF